MAVSLNMGVEGVSYQPSVVDSRSDYPRRKVNLPVSASIPSHVERVFNLDASDRVLTNAIRPRLSNPDVTIPAHYARLFDDIEAETARYTGESGETARIVQSARSLLLAMRSDFEAFASSRNALIKA